MFYVTDLSNAILLWWFLLFYVLVFNSAPYVYVFIFLVKFG